MNKISKVIIGLVVILIVVGIGGYFYYENSLGAVDVNNKDILVVEVEEGTPGNKIADILFNNNLIKNKNTFKLFLRINKINDLKSGQYEFTQSMNVNDLVDSLRKGGKNTKIIRFTIPEGYELKQIAEKLSSEGIVDKDIFLEKVSNKKNYEDEFDFLRKLNKDQSLEGYLFPSTYEVDEDSTEDEIIVRMLKEFEIVYDKFVLADEKSVDLDFNEIVTLASIIERESRRPEERTTISAVFHNRLKDDMKLQSCATVQFILGERKEVLSNADTRIESEYNTYLYTGLPPSPISSVGKESLIAAVNPEKVDYLYFRTKEDGTGGHVFSKTYEEHLKAKPNK